MALFEVEINTESLSAALDRAIDPAPLLDRIGAFVASKVQERFRTQPWAPRAVPNIGGILSYLAKGQSNPEIPARYFQSRPALVDTGRLRASITHRVVATDTIAVGTNLGYARKQLLGEPSTVKGAGKGGDAKVRRGLAKWLKRHPDDREMLGWLFARDEVTITPRARNFLEITPELVGQIEGVVDDWVEEQTHGA